jgi:hypothetical protein
VQRRFAVVIEESKEELDQGQIDAKEEQMRRAMCIASLTHFPASFSSVNTMSYKKSSRWQHNPYRNDPTAL